MPTPAPRRNLITQIHVLSSVPGRARFAYPPVQSQRPLALGIEAALRRVPGVRSARANPLTARVLVEFDPARVPLEEIAVAIATARAPAQGQTLRLPAHQARAAWFPRGSRHRFCSSTGGTDATAG